LTCTFSVKSESRSINPPHRAYSTMETNGITQNGSNFVLSGDTLNKALPDMGMATRAVHADDFVTPHRAIAPGMHVAVNFRYARDPDHLVPEENNDVSLP